jgi:hypothetical protein
MALVLSVIDVSNFLGSKVHLGRSSGTCICPVKFTKTRVTLDKGKSDKMLISITSTVKRDSKHAGSLDCTQDIRFKKI